MMNIFRVTASVLVCLCAASCATVVSYGVPGDFGAEPADYASAVHTYFQQALKDPESAQFRQIGEPHQGDLEHWMGLVNGGMKTNYGWIVDVTVNAKNSYGAYVGYRTYSFLFRGESIVDVIEPQ